MFCGQGIGAGGKREGGALSPSDKVPAESLSFSSREISSRCSRLSQHCGHGGVFTCLVYTVL